jgi:hypothetical protein
MRVMLKNVRRSAAALAAVLALTVVWAGSSVRAQDADDEDLPGDTKFFRKLFKEFGMQRDDERIEFRERAPLVVPPSRSLPAPQSADAVRRNAAWPKDPDERRRNEAIATPGQKARLRGAAEAMVEEGRALRPDELEVGRVAPTTPTSVQDPNASARPLPPSALGSKGFLDFFSSKPDKPAEFANEPPRASLTDPPAGYQTPSAAQPYALGPARDEPSKPQSLWDRAAGPER